MSNFFQNKKNVVLVIILVLLLLLGGFLGYKIIFDPSVICADFSDLREEEIINWAKKKRIIDKLEIKHEFDNDIESGTVIYQSVKEGDEIGDTLLVIISDGVDTSKIFDIPVDELESFDDIYQWFKENGFSNINYIYVKDDERNAGEIVSVDPITANVDRKVNVEIIGEPVPVPDFTNVTDNYISEWAKENSIDVDIEYENSSAEEGTIVEQSYSSGETISTGSHIIIYKSNGIPPEEENDDSESSSNNTVDKSLQSSSIKTAYIDEYEFLGKSEEVFKNSLKELGFNNTTKVEAVFSRYDKDTICYYLPDGKQALDTEIKYKLSLGIFDDTKYNGLTLDAAKTKINDINSENGSNLILGTSKSASSKVEAGKLFDCGYSGSKISCKLSTGKDGETEKEEVDKIVYIDEMKYLGMDEEKFTNELNKLGFDNLKKIDAVFSNYYNEGKICYYLPDGKQYTSQEIKYKVSVGKFSPEDYNGKTENDVKTKINNINEKYNGSLKLKTTETASSEYSSGKLFDCSVNSSTISCKLSTGSNGQSSLSGKKAYIDENLYMGKTEDAFIKKLNDLGFNNLKRIDAQFSSFYAAGNICYYLPDGNQYLDTEIDYKVSLGKSSDFNGLTESQAKAKIDKLNTTYDVESSLKLTNVKSTSVEVGKLFNCSSSGKTMSCSLSSGSDSGQASNPTIAKVEIPNFTSNPCGGSTKSCSLSNPKLNYNVSFEYSNSVQEGNIISTSPSIGSKVNENSTVDVVISTGVKKKTILSASSYRAQSAKCTTPSETINLMDNLLQGFTIVYVTDLDNDLGAGKIISISVDGNSNYVEGLYPITTPIVVKISSGYRD